MTLLVGEVWEVEFTITDRATKGPVEPDTLTIQAVRPDQTTTPAAIEMTGEGEGIASVVLDQVGTWKLDAKSPVLPHAGRGVIEERAVEPREPK